MESSNGSLVVVKGVKVATLYLFIGHIVPSTLIVSEKNKCSGIVAAVEKEEYIANVNSDIALWHNIIGHE